jgi:hypothetical protein
VVAHPGYSATNLQLSGPPPYERLVMRVSNRLFAQPAEMGALPLLYAATAPELPGGSYVGPDGMGEMRGHPVLVQATERARDEESARRLWEISEELTGVAYDFKAPTGEKSGAEDPSRGHVRLLRSERLGFPGVECVRLALHVARPVGQPLQSKVAVLVEPARAGVLLEDPQSCAFRLKCLDVLKQSRAEPAALMIRIYVEVIEPAFREAGETHDAASILNHPELVPGRDPAAKFRAILVRSAREVCH